jgi:hypothetical protein
MSTVVYAFLSVAFTGCTRSANHHRLSYINCIILPILKRKLPFATSAKQKKEKVQRILHVDDDIKCAAITCCRTSTPLDVCEVGWRTSSILHGPSARHACNPPSGRASPQPLIGRTKLEDATQPRQIMAVVCKCEVLRFGSAPWRAVTMHSGSKRASR